MFAIFIIPTHIHFARLRWFGGTGAVSGGTVNARRVSLQRPLRARQDLRPPSGPTLKKERTIVEKQMRPVIIDQADLPWEGWADAALAARSAIRWKLLTAGERTGSAGLVTGLRMNARPGPAAFGAGRGTLRKKLLHREPLLRRIIPSSPSRPALWRLTEHPGPAHR